VHAVLPLCLLVLFVLWKPQEIAPVLAEVPWLEAFVVLAFVAWLVGCDSGRLRPRWPPHGTVVALFFGWALVTRLVGAGGHRFAEVARDLLIPLLLYFALALGASSLRASGWLSGALLIACLGVGFVGLHQGASPLGCALQDGDSLESLRPDGRPCVQSMDCHEGGEPGAIYRCERVGLFGTVSVGEGRVRYRGVLKDPNELALATASAAPLALSWAQRRRRGLGSRALAWLSVVALAVVVVLTRSRAGLLVLAAALGARAFARHGRRAVGLALVAGVAMVALGGRSGDEASASSDERRDLLGVATQLFVSNPVFGVGFGRFTEYSELTAHNSYALVLAELGAPGLWLFVATMVVAALVPIEILKATRSVPEARSARALASAQLGMIAATVVGSAFLSVAYHQLVWIEIALTGALHGAVKPYVPELSAGLSLRWAFVVTGIAAAIPIGLHFVSRWGSH
jgi:hypothetical protein